jgi:hypothetical protein
MPDKLTKEQVRDAVNIILEYESPETFSDPTKLKEAIEGHFDAIVDIEHVKEYVRPLNFDSVDRFLTLKNIGY